MVVKKQTSVKGKTRGGQDFTKKKTVSRMSRRELELEKAKLAAGNPSVQKERTKQEGKTSRTKARSAAVGASGVSAASNLPQDQSVVFQGMAGGGVGSEDSGNTTPEKGSGNPSGVRLG